MKKFITIFFKEKMDNITRGTLTDFFIGLVGANLKEEVCDNTISYIFDANVDVDFNEIILNINTDFYLSAKLYESKDFLDETKIARYLLMIQSIKVTSIEEEYFIDDDLVIKNLGDLALIREVVLRKYHNDFEMLDVIKAYLDSNMNVSQAANKLFMHRNTVMNKIERFIDVTGYDIKKFKKAFVVYHLIY